MDFEIVEDANKNGVPEVLFSKSRCELSGCSGELKVVEWNDNTLTTVLYESELGTFYDEVKIEDLDNDGINEFFWSGNTPLEGSWNWEVGGPWRSETRIYKWNGTTFAPEPVKYSLPKFRFQALQDSDRYILENKYADALSLYQEVIDNNGLEWWSPERNSQQHDIALTIGTNLPTPTLIPPDPTEYPRLAAYAYYRIMLLHLAQGQEAEAAFTYQTLQETFGNDPYAAPYVKMATEFWKSYQSTRRMYVGCAAAIQNAVEHPEILIPLGSDYHGWQSHIYEPADVCPFR
jgi:hypothetical protein